MLFVFALCRGVFTDSNIVENALIANGFQNISIIDKSFFLVGLRGCSGKDAALFKTRAINPTGKDVEIIVCVGWPFKGATIRVK